MMEVAIMISSFFQDGLYRVLTCLDEVEIRFQEALHSIYRGPSAMVEIRVGN